MTRDNLADEFKIEACQELQKRLSEPQELVKELSAALAVYLARIREEQEEEG